MLSWAFAHIRCAYLVVALLAVSLLTCEPTARRFGDTLQVALPLLAWGCSAARGNGAEAVLRFAGVFAVAHGSKRLLGDAPVNQRPSGGGQGFPSAHTAAAVFGASALVHECIAAYPLARGIVILSAGYVGASRIEAGKHDIWQVLAGAVLGWGGERILRSDRRRRAAVRAGFGAITGLVLHGMRGISRAVFRFIGKTRDGQAKGRQGWLRQT